MTEPGELTIEALANKCRLLLIENEELIEYVDHLQTKVTLLENKMTVAVAKFKYIIESDYPGGNFAKIAQSTLDIIAGEKC